MTSQRLRNRLARKWQLNIVTAWRFTTCFLPGCRFNAICNDFLGQVNISNQTWRRHREVIHKYWTNLQSGFTRWQGIHHSLCAHGHTIGDSNGVELKAIQLRVLTWSCYKMDYVRTLNVKRCTSRQQSRTWSNSAWSLYVISSYLQYPTKLPKTEVWMIPPTSGVQVSLSTSFFTSSPKESKCILHGLPWYHTEAMPTCHQIKTCAAQSAWFNS